MGIRNDVDILNLNLAQLCFNLHTLSKQRGQTTVHRISKQSLINRCYHGNIPTIIRLVGVNGKNNTNEAKNYTCGSLLISTCAIVCGRIKGAGVPINICMP